MTMIRIYKFKNWNINYIVIFYKAADRNLTKEYIIIKFKDGHIHR